MWSINVNLRLLKAKIVLCIVIAVVVVVCVNVVIVANVVGVALFVVTDRIIFSCGQ